MMLILYIHLALYPPHCIRGWHRHEGTAQCIRGKRSAEPRPLTQCRDDVDCMPPGRCQRQGSSLGSCKEAGR